MLVYIILMSICIIFHYLYKYKILNAKTQNILFWGLCVLFTLVSALRYGVGTDYFDTYANILHLVELGRPFHFEFLFLKLNELVVFFGGNIQMLMAICAILTVPMFFLFVKRNVTSKYWFFSIFLFIGFTIYYATMNVVRQYVAIAILLLAYDFFKNKKYIGFILLALLAALFHTSAIISLLILPVYFIVKNGKITKLFVFFYFISLICIFVDAREIFKLLDFLIPSRYINYLNSEFFINKNYLAALKLIVPNLLLIIMFIYRGKLRKQNTQFDILFSAWYIYVLISNAFYGINVFIRLGWYFDYYILLIAPMIVEFCEKQRWKIKVISRQYFFSSLLVMAFFGYCFVWNAYSIFYKGGHGVVPYNTVWSCKEMIGD